MAISPNSGPLRGDRVGPERPQAQAGSDRITLDLTGSNRIGSGRAGGARKGPDRAGACPGPADDDHLQLICDALPDDLSAHCSFGLY